MSALDGIQKRTFTPEKMTPLDWVIWNSRASLPSDLLEQAAQQLQRLAKRAADGSDACVCLTRPPTNYLGNCVSCGLPRR